MKIRAGQVWQHANGFKVTVLSVRERNVTVRELKTGVRSVLQRRRFGVVLKPATGLEPGKKRETASIQPLKKSLGE
jgi:hypothetical protein